MGPLISCFMYDGWHAFEYLHVSEVDANRWWGGSWLKWDIFVNKHCKYVSGCNAEDGPGRGVCLGNR